MDSVYEKTLSALEFPKILSLISGCSLTPYGSERTLALTPGSEVDQVRRSLREAAQVRDILEFGDPFPLARIDDIRQLLNKSAIEGSHLEAGDFIPIRETIAVVARLKAFKKDERENFADFAEYLERLGSFAELKSQIDRTISESGEIKENATPFLRKISSEISDTRRRLIVKLNELLSKRAKAQGWQDDVVTQRHNRYVIPVPASSYRSGDGIVVDQSQSGATMFIEPPIAVELNNALSLAEQKRFREIARILIELTALLREHADALEQTLEIVGVIDSLHSIATFALKIDALAPEIIFESEVDLIEARHPLLLYYNKDSNKDKSSVIPLDISLNKGRQAILITGPNTGGKTVALKTVGLLSLMAASGILVPADPKSKIGLFEQIFADIGDEQSIELSLSTYSSHIIKVIHAVKHANSRSLLLFDEVGAGTDPAEGAALAEALILRIVELGAKLIVTTHYSQLKTLPLSHPAIENASLEFDRESLRPTYRVQMGVPGSSYAIEIAERLGMPLEIVREAAKHLGSEQRSLSDLITSMEDQLRQVREDSAKLADKVSTSAELERYYKAKLEELQANLEETKQESLKETEELIKRTRAELEGIVRKIRESQASSESVKDAHRMIRERSADVTGLRSTPAGRKSVDTSELKPGDAVWVNTLRIDGEVAELVGDDRVRVRVGNMLNLVKRADLTKANLPIGQTRPSRTPSGLRDETAPLAEIHLRGLTVEEATEKLDKFLDSAILSGLGQVYVIHGKGTGTLRKALTSYMKNHTGVDSMRLGDWNQGGAGVTIVTLK